MLFRVGDHAAEKKGEDAVMITFALFNGSFGVKILDFLLLAGIFVVGLRMSLRSFRPRYAGGTFQVSRILAGSYCLLLLAASIYCIILLFLPPQS